MVERSLRRRLCRTLRSYCAATSTHGVAYVARAEEPFLGRIIWFSLVAAGFAMATLNFRSTWHGWQVDPTITTIATATRPIWDLPFPTVAVCPDRDTPPDSAAYPEKILNAMAFDCATKGEDDDCDSEIDPLREEFGFLLDFMLSVLTRAMFRAEGALNDTDEVPRDLFYFTNKYDSGVVDHVLLNGLADFYDLYEVNLKQVGRISKVNYYQMLNETFANGTYRGEADVACVLKDEAACSEAAKDALVLKALAEATLPLRNSHLRSLPFGTLLFAALPVLDPILFSRQERIWSNEFYHGFYSDGVVYNDVLTPETETVHHLGAELSAAVFGKDGPMAKVSLYDVPLMFGRWPVTNLFQQNIRDHFPYSLFKLNENGTDTDYVDHFLCNRFSEEAIYRPEEMYVPGDLCASKKVCCVTRDLLRTGDLPALMTVMSHAFRRGGSHENYRELIRPFMHANGTSKLRFGLRDGGGLLRKDDDRELFPYVDDLGAMVPYCKYESGEHVQKYEGQKEFVPECTVFRPAPTNAGMCHAFNARMPFRESAFTRAMEEVYGSGKRDSERLFEDDVVRSVSHGYGLGLTFVLKRQTYLRTEWHEAAKYFGKGGFDVSVSPPWGFFNFANNKRHVRMGYHTTLRVRPLVVNSDDALRALAVEDRNCLFPDEKELKILKGYSHAGCMHECALEMARQRCGCTPWDYPFPPDEEDEHRICDYLGYYCFEEVVNNVTGLLDRCRCLQDCDVLEYEVTSSDVPLVGNEVCLGNTWASELVRDRFADWRFPDMLYLFYKIGLGKKLADPDNSGVNAAELIYLCEKTLEEDVALVTVEVASDRFVENQRAIKVSTSEKMASFGGTLGLFTGMSFLGIFEVFYWMAKVLFRGGGKPIEETNN